MTNNSGKRIIKNTLLLYVRMIVVALVSFYTTRVILQILGVEDFGVRNVISGLIGFLSILTSVMVNAAQRFLAFDLGRNDTVQYQKSFSMLLNVFLIISIVGILLMELIGPYIISLYLVIPPNRLSAAQWIFQFTIIGFVVSTIIVPYTSSVIAYEKMDIFAYVSLLEAGLKLLVVYLLYVIPYDKLITVVFFTVMSTVVSNSIYIVYCRTKFEGCRYVPIWDKPLLIKLSSFMGWNLFGSATSVLNVQGQALILNMFFGPVVNAAKAIADNVQALVQQFVSNFYMAVGPQIVKSYAADEKDYTKSIVLNSSKLAFFLIVALSIPLIKDMEPLLGIWLGKNSVTDQMVIFAQWALIQSMAQSMDYPITQTVRATGDIKKYQIYVGVQTLSFIPICYIAFKLGAEPVTSMLILTIITIIVQVYRVYVLSTILDVTIQQYYRKVFIPIFIVLILDYLVLQYISIPTDSFIGLSVSLVLSFLISVVLVFVFGTTLEEKRIVVNYINKRIRKQICQV